LDQEDAVDLPDKLLMQISRMTQGHPRDALSALESAIQYADSGDLENIEDVISEVERDLLQSSPFRLTQEYAYHLLTGNTLSALTSVRAASSMEFFMQLAITSIKQVILHKINSSSADPSYSRMARSIKHLNISDAAAILRKFIEGLALLKEYTVESKDIVDLITIESCELMRA